MNGKVNGIYKWYYGNGKPKQETYYTNDIEGITILYDENGNEIKKIKLPDL
ncbi:MAG TPA: hypothetical protein VK890_04685 [Bacteroidia bacterium]|nr:hypothetical protein [Bacteroidia bacterium]